VVAREMVHDLCFFEQFVMSKFRVVLYNDNANCSLCTTYCY